MRAAIRGVRFAPSPTGVFHLGNLRTAWISHRLAQLLNEPWAVRFEDIDRPRVVAGALERQLADMAALGLVPNLLSLQSDFHERHLAVFLRAVAERRVYPCFCSRKEVRAALGGAVSAPHGRPPQYSGHCRPRSSTRPRTGEAASAFRPKSPENETMAWRFRMEDESGAHDFIVARAGAPERDGAPPPTETFTPAYNWACAIDDFDGVYHVIARASDLEGVLDEQRAIQRMLVAWGGSLGVIPAVYHCALVTGDSGERLEKRTKGVTLAELGERGYPPARLAECFERGFEPPELSELRPEAVAGERFRTLTVSQVLGGGS